MAQQKSVRLTDVNLTLSLFVLAIISVMVVFDRLV